MTIFSTHNRYKFIYQHTETCEEECIDDIKELHNIVDKERIEAIKQKLMTYYSTKPEFHILKKELNNTYISPAMLKNERTEFDNVRDNALMQEEITYNQVNKVLSENASLLSSSAYGYEIERYIGNNKALEELSKTDNKKYNDIKNTLDMIENRLYIACYDNKNIAFNEQIKPTDSINTARHGIVNELMKSYMYLPKDRSYKLYSALESIKNVDIETYDSFFESYMGAMEKQLTGATEININTKILNDIRFKPLLETINELAYEDKLISIDINLESVIKIAHALELKDNNKAFYNLKEEDIKSKIVDIKERVACKGELYVLQYAEQLSVLAGVLKAKAGHMYQLETWYAPGFIGNMTIQTKAERDTLYKHFQETIDTVCHNNNIVSFPNGDIFEIPKNGIYDKNTMPESIVINDQSYSTEAFLNEYRINPEATLKKYDAIRLGTIEDTIAQILLSGDITNMRNIGALQDKESSMAYEINENYSFEAQVKKEGKALAITNNVINTVGTLAFNIINPIDNIQAVYEVYTNEDVKRLADMGLIPSSEVSKIDNMRIAAGGIAMIGMIPGGDTIKLLKHADEMGDGMKVLKNIGKAADKLGDGMSRLSSIRGATAIKYAAPTTALMLAGTMDVRAEDKQKEQKGFLTENQQQLLDNASWEESAISKEFWVNIGVSSAMGVGTFVVGSILKSRRGHRLEKEMRTLGNELTEKEKDILDNAIKEHNDTSKPYRITGDDQKEITDDMKTFVYKGKDRDQHKIVPQAYDGTPSIKESTPMNTATTTILKGNTDYNEKKKEYDVAKEKYKNNKFETTEKLIMIGGGLTTVGMTSSALIKRYGNPEEDRVKNIRNTSQQEVLDAQDKAYDEFFLSLSPEFKNVFIAAERISIDHNVHIKYKSLIPFMFHKAKMNLLNIGETTDQQGLFYFIKNNKPYYCDPNKVLETLQMNTAKVQLMKPDQIENNQHIIVNTLLIKAGVPIEVFTAK